MGEVLEGFFDECDACVGGFVEVSDDFLEQCLVLVLVGFP